MSEVASDGGWCNYGAENFGSKSSDSNVVSKPGEQMNTGGLDPMMVVVWTSLVTAVTFGIGAKD